MTDVVTQMEATRTLLDEVKAICELLGAKPVLGKAAMLADRLANE